MTRKVIAVDIEDLAYKIDRRIAQMTVEAEDQIFALAKIWPMKEVEKAYKRFRELKAIGLDETEIIKKVANEPEIFPVKYLKKDLAKKTRVKTKTSEAKE